MNGDCFAITGSTCHMKDPVSGNTWRCDCDGDCNTAVRMMAEGQCRNPYEQSSSSDSLHLGSSSSANSSASSSGSSSDSGGSSPSSGGSGGSSPSSGGSGDDFEYDYTALLENIEANTQYTGQQTRNLNDKATQANDLLQQIANKDFSPTINVGGPNVTLNADTARAPAAILGLLQDKFAGGEPNSADTAGSGAALQSRLDKIDSAVSATDVPDMSDSIAPTLQGIRGEVAAMRDSITGGVMGDSVNAWRNAFLNNGVLTGNGSNTCPAALTRQVSFTFPPVGTIQAGTLGSYLCTPITGFSVTLWQVARMLLRAMVAVGCMWWLFKEVTGTTSGGSNDDD